MTPEQLARLLDKEESVYIEFKEKIDLESKEGKADFLREMMALANSDDRHIFCHAGYYYLSGLRTS
jgi:hypothetical protein